MSTIIDRLPNHPNKNETRLTTRQKLAATALAVGVGGVVGLVAGDSPDKPVTHENQKTTAEAMVHTGMVGNVNQIPGNGQFEMTPAGSETPVTVHYNAVLNDNPSLIGQKLGKDAESREEIKDIVLDKEIGGHVLDKQGFDIPEKLVKPGAPVQREQQPQG